MDPRFRKVAVFVGAAALAGGVGVGVASQGGDAASSPAAMSRQAGGPDGPGGPIGMDVSALAEKLGVTEARLEAAMRKARPSGDPGTAGPPPSGGDDPMAAALAEELGLSTEKVTAALDAVRPQGIPPGAAPNGTTPPATDGSTAGSTAA
jgi:hypothetical protein